MGELLSIGDSAVVAVSELAYGTPGCPDRETVIGIFRIKQPAQMLKIAKPLAAVERTDIEQAAEAARPMTDPALGDA